MKRLCFLVPDVHAAHATVQDLRAAGIGGADIHVIANERTELGDLPDAGSIERSDFYPQLKRGLGIGAAIGAIGGLIAMRAAGVVLGGGAVLLFGAVGAGVNALLAATAGAAFPNSRLAQFEDAIEAGNVLIMVDAPPSKVEGVENLVKSRHPAAEIEGFEPHTRIFAHRA